MAIVTAWAANCSRTGTLRPTSTSIWREWPLVGRDEELDLLRSLRRAPVATSAVVTGPAGVGKSKLVAVASDDAAEDGWSVVSVRGSVGLGSVALAPFRMAFQLSEPDDPATIASTIERVIGARTATQRVLLAVDDSQELDDPSAGLLHQLVATGAVTAIVAARSGARAPEAVVNLWKDGLARRVELQDLSRGETTELLAVALGEGIRDSTISRLWRMTGGNPLYVREVVLATLESGALAWESGQWRLRGGWSAGERLQEIVAARIGRLDAEAATALELVALAGPLSVDLVMRLAMPRALEELESRGLIRVTLVGDHFEAVVEHPIHAEVLRGAMPQLRQRALWRNIVEAAHALGVRTDSDRIRLACWSIEAGVRTDPRSSTLGRDASLYPVGHAIAQRLHEIVPDAAATTPTPEVRHDPGLALRLAAAAYEASGSLVDGIALAEALAWLGHIRQAEGVLAELGDKAVDPDRRARLSLERGWLAFWGRHDVVSAEVELRGLLATKDPYAPELRASAHQELAGILLNTARPSAALEQAIACAATEGVALHQSEAAPVAAAAMLYLGRCAEAIEHADESIVAASTHTHLLRTATLLFAKASALGRQGQLHEALRIAEWLHEVSLSNELLDPAAAFGVLYGELLVREGLPASACRILLDASGLLAERDVLSYRAWALGNLSRARALSGDLEKARAALNEARSLQDIPRHFDASVDIAEIEVHRLEGDREAAVRVAERGAEWARRAEMVVDEAMILLAWASVAPSAALATQAVGLTKRSSSELVAVIADYTRSVAEHDAHGLLAAGERFARVGMRWHAADATAEASQLFARHHDDRRARSAAAAASAHARQCEGAQIPSVDALQDRGQLTPREREIALLAAAGATSRDIARQKFISQRTVENHLHRAYLKLGVGNRAALAAALSADASCGGPRPHVAVGLER
jgi:DNA-binding CsgD family transcriptional regulator